MIGVRWLRIPRNAVLGGLALAVLVWLAGWVIAAPRRDSTRRSPAALRLVAAARDVAFSADELPVVQRDVDYAPGPPGAWFPRGEAPVLAALVRDGLLPPVAARLPRDPLVLVGAEGVGEYGGTWLRIGTSLEDVRLTHQRVTYTALVRWSPLGYPIRPHLARGVAVSADQRTFTITLRDGARWSDGRPFTTADLLYWWRHEVNDPAVSGIVPAWLVVAGQPARLEALDALHLRVSFAAPNRLFPELLARYSHTMVNSPAHYLRPFHPTLGDAARCARTMADYGLPSRRAAYSFIRQEWNPEHPRLWPWLYRTYTASPPYVFVRNPYYFAVDDQGNQLPYLDRVQYDLQSDDMVGLNAATGGVSMQARHLHFADYTEIMSRRVAGSYVVRHWYPATRSDFVINPNLNRRVDPEQPATRWKARLLADRRFRQALSLAINRKAIIRAEYSGQARPAQVAPGPESPFHHQGLEQAFVAHDPRRAAALLDELGLTGRDADGLRQFPDGSPMVFFLDYCAYTGLGPLQLVVDDWARSGVRVILRERSRRLFHLEKDARTFDLDVWSSASDFLPLVSPRSFVPFGTESFWAVGWGEWFVRGGLRGAPEARCGDCVEPPPDHPVRRAMRAYTRAREAAGPAEQAAAVGELLDLAAENLWTIGLTTPPPRLVVVGKDFRNVPRNALYGNAFFTPGNAAPETFFLTAPDDSDGARAALRVALVAGTPRPGPATGGGVTVAGLVRLLLGGVALLVLLLAALRHPFVGRRLLIMVPTLAVISVVVFTVVQLPPGDYLTTRVAMLEASGETADLQDVADLKTLFHFDEPGWKRYLRWVGLTWFATFQRDDRGLLQGHLGRSMETGQEVNALVGERIVLTVLISLGTILFTWALAIPMGIFSAARQYSLADHVLTFLGFIGMCVPAFLLALILVAVSGTSGLFSPEYAARPEWSWGKVWDLARHIWIPIVVLGVGGTAGMIRVMRANLLDELRQPYVVAARARGVRPLRLLFKYPVRLALNPFVSGIGSLFPHLVSGGAIVAIVLSLPTVGPLLLGALFSEDMYLAGSLLMVLSLLSVFGTLVSDLLLLWLDPRIRYEGGSR